jgi:hypothetical protein
VSEPTADDLYALWKTILDAVYAEIIELHANREIWQFFNDTLGNAKHGQITHDALARWYVDAQAACVRRQYTDSDALSLGRLLRSLRANAQVVTRERFRSLWPQLTEPGGDPHGNWSDWADKGFDSWALDGGSTLDPSIVDADIEHLATMTQKISRWADENVAHNGRKKSVSVTFGELDAAIEALGELLKKYYGLLTAALLATPTPSLPLPWKEPFRAALIGPND